MPGSSYSRPLGKVNISLLFRPSVIRGPWTGVLQSDFQPNFNKEWHSSMPWGVFLLDLCIMLSMKYSGTTYSIIKWSEIPLPCSREIWNRGSKVWSHFYLHILTFLYCKLIMMNSNFRYQVPFWLLPRNVNVKPISTHSAPPLELSH